MRGVQGSGNDGSVSCGGEPQPGGMVGPGDQAHRDLSVDVKGGPWPGAFRPDPGTAAGVVDQPVVANERRPRQSPSSAPVAPPGPPARRRPPRPGSAWGEGARRRSPRLAFSHGRTLAAARRRGCRGRRRTRARPRTRPAGCGARRGRRPTVAAASGGPSSAERSGRARRRRDARGIGTVVRRWSCPYGQLLRISFSFASSQVSRSCSGIGSSSRSSARPPRPLGVYDPPLTSRSPPCGRHRPSRPRARASAARRRRPASSGPPRSARARHA